MICIALPPQKKPFPWVTFMTERTMDVCNNLLLVLSGRGDPGMENAFCTTKSHTWCRMGESILDVLYAEK